MYRPFGGLTPLLFAAREGCLECARTLVEGGAKLDLPDPKGVTPLFLAIDNFHFDLAKYLIEKGANPNKWDWWGRTPLYSAVDVEHGAARRPRRICRRPTPRRASTIIELLLKAGAWPNVQLKMLAAVSQHRRRPRLRPDADDGHDAVAARREDLRHGRDRVAARSTARRSICRTKAASRRSWRRPATARWNAIRAATGPASRTT